ncbi:hypothetical protein ACIRBX_24940 [Kitasatospora sp. NPDC096147]|uniref:hypothetical protein n=1 Tax=Kitasatospora sp. NPDC096147 TaxID=3364093 RepID=UPI00382EDA23
MNDPELSDEQAAAILATGTTAGTRAQVLAHLLVTYGVRAAECPALSAEPDEDDPDSWNLTIPNGKVPRTVTITGETARLVTDYRQGLAATGDYLFPGITPEDVTAIWNGLVHEAGVRPTSTHAARLRLFGRRPG